MKKVTDEEINACHFLSRFGVNGGFCPSDGFGDTVEGQRALDVLGELVRKRRAVRIDGDAGPVYSLTDLGWSEVD